MKEKCQTCGQTLPTNFEKVVFDASLWSIQKQDKLVKAFIAETGLKPSECVLVEEIVPNTENPGITIRHIYMKRDIYR